jgi:hypothetical protein
MSTPVGDGTEGRGLGIMKKAAGGTIYGPGSATSDSIPVWLSNGEEVTRTAMADKHRPLLKAINADRLDEYFRSGARHASGGTVGYASPVQYVRSDHAGGGGSSSPVTNKRGGDTWNISTPNDPRFVASIVESRQAKKEWGER